jgi:hypothetical protein
MTSTASPKRRLQLEALEERAVPTVTYHGGGVLPHVEVQGLYLGADWNNNPTYRNQAVQLDGFNRYLVQSSYMDLLNNLGYGVGRGSASGGIIDLTSIDKRYYLLDSTIRSDLQRDISSRALQQPDSNRLYVIYVEPGVAIMNDHDHNSTSIRNFYGYHGAFAGRTANGAAVDVHYAVVAYPGGYNPGIPGLTAVQSMTSTASHEIAEAVTDPNVNFRTLGWYDDNRHAEIGDINRYEALLGGYVIQSIINRNDVAYIPAGATLLSNQPFSHSSTSAAGHSSLPDAALLDVLFSQRGHDHGLGFLP